MTTRCTFHHLTDRPSDRCSEPAGYDCLIPGPDDRVQLCAPHTLEAARRVVRMIEHYDLGDVLHPMQVEPMA